MIPKMRIVRTSSVVATGRSDEGLCEIHGQLLPRPGPAGVPLPPRSPSRPPAPRSPAPPPRAPAVETCTPGVRRSWPSVTTTSRLSEPALDDHVLVDLARHRDGPDLDRVVGLHDVDVLAGRRRQHGGTRDDDRPCLVRQIQRHLDEQAGPQALAAVLERALQLDRPGGRIDGVVDECHAPVLDEARLRRHRGPLPRRDVAAERWRLLDRRRRLRAGRDRRLPARRDDERLLRLIAANVTEVAPRDRERHVNRRHLVDHDERRGVVGAHEIAHVDAKRAGAARHRRGDPRVGEIQFRVLDCRAARRQCRLERFVARPLRLVLIARDQTALEEILVPRQLLFGVARRRACRARAPPRPVSAAASNGRASIVNSNCPLRTSCPSAKWMALN